jgi:hypothetical protein
VTGTEHTDREPNSRNRSVLSVAAPLAFGILGVAVLGLIAVVLPSPTPFQYVVFRTLLALAGAGVAASFPGFLSIDRGNRIISGLLRMVAAFAVFILIYLFAPSFLSAG